jgi:riboflavin kinase/FMN adenylyltransferase
MEVLHALPLAPLAQDCALTVGTFDGVHRGHQALVERLRSEAARRNLQTAVLTFTDMPYCYFRPDDCPCLLTLPDEKIAAFERLGIDRLFIIPFNKQLAEQAAPDFVQHILIERLRMKLLLTGPDFALGKGRAGDVHALREMGNDYGFEMAVLDDKLTEASTAISSTRTRECIESGDVTSATRLLGHPFSLSGTVIGGRQLGRTIGVPTINIKPHPRKVVPATGIYAARAFFDDGSTSHPAALSIGTNPTVGGSTLSIEFHVIGEDIAEPPQRARLEIVERLRDEWKFDGVKSLVEQMQRDITQAREILQQT